MAPGARRALAILVAGVIFAVDLAIPLGVAGGVPYLVVVLVVLGLPDRRETLYFALGCSVLTLLGLLLSPGPDQTELWKVFTNRGLALFAIWVTAAIGLQRSRAQINQTNLGRILDDSPSEIYVFDAKSLRLVQVNRGARENLGYSMEELLELTPRDLAPDLSLKAFAGILEPLRSGEQEDARFTTRYRRRDGTFYPVEVYIHPATFEFAPVFSAIVTDITERVEAEQALRESERRLRRMVENLPAGAVYVEGNSPFLNRTAEQITGYDRNEIQTLDDWFTRLYGDRADLMRARYEESRRANFPVPRTLEITRKDGVTRRVEFSSYRHEDGTVWLMNDVTERVRAQEKLRKTEQRMRAAEQLASLSTLTAGIAHDVGTPMNVILGYAQMMERSEKDPKNRERLRTIREQAQRVTQLIQTLLDFARPRKTLRIAVDLGDVLDACLSFLEERFQKHRILIKRSFESAPAIRADRDQLQQLFLNVFVNATDAMPDGGELRISLKRCNAENVEVRVADTGKGIDKDELEHIFEPFYTTKDRTKGTGLGLSVSKRIVVEHGGEISVSSEVQKGTEFRFVLPIDGAPG